MFLTTARWQASQRQLTGVAVTKIGMPAPSSTATSRPGRPEPVTARLRRSIEQILGR